LSQLEFRVFDVFDVNTQTYYGPEARQRLCTDLAILHVPVVHQEFLIEDETMQDMLSLADGNSTVGNATPMREGLVYKALDGSTSFKTISNKYLVKQND
jgi:ATP-dependent RNA circularization protein (DNA/RNA ligase family)